MMKEKIERVDDMFNYKIRLLTK